MIMINHSNNHNFSYFRGCSMHLIKFMLGLDYEILGKINDFVDLHSIFMSCNLLFKLRRHLIYLKLNQSHSLRYLTDEYFHRLVQSRVFSTRKQILVKLIYLLQYMRTP